MTTFEEYSKRTNQVIALLTTEWQANADLARRLGALTKDVAPLLRRSLYTRKVQKQKIANKLYYRLQPLGEDVVLPVYTPPSGSETKRLMDLLSKEWKAAIFIADEAKIAPSQIGSLFAIAVREGAIEKRRRSRGAYYRLGDNKPLDMIGQDEDNEFDHPVIIKGGYKPPEQNLGPASIFDLHRFV